MANNPDIKKQELEWWHQYNQGNTSVLPKLLTSLDPIIQWNVNKFSATPLPRSALESEARRLTVGSFKSYDPNMGAALNTHVTNHLKHLQRYVLQYQNVGKIPEHRGIAISRYQNVKDNLEQELNRAPNTIEISEAIGWSPQEVERMESELRQDLVIGTGKEDSSSFFDSAFHEKDKNKEMLEFIYFSADPLKKKIMEYSFGLGGQQVLSFEEMLPRLGISETQLRKIRSEIAMEVNKYERYF